MLVVILDGTGVEHFWGCGAVGLGAWRLEAGKAGNMPFHM